MYLNPFSFIPNLFAANAEVFQVYTLFERDIEAWFLRELDRPASL